MISLLLRVAGRHPDFHTSDKGLKEIISSHVWWVTCYQRLAQQAGWILEDAADWSAFIPQHARDSIQGQFAQQLLQSLCVGASSGVIWWFAERIQRCTIILVAESSIKNNWWTALCGVTFLQIAFMLTWACTWLAFNLFNCTVLSPQCAAVWECFSPFSYSCRSSWNVLEIQHFNFSLLCFLRYRAWIKISSFMLVNC